MNPSFRSPALVMVGLALAAFLAVWFVAHIVIKGVIFLLLVVATAWLAHTLSRPHPEVFGPGERRGVDR